MALVEKLSRATESAPEVPDEIEPEQPKNDEQGGEEEVADEATPEETSDEALREELASLKKDELLAFAKDNGLEIDGLEKRTKADIIEFIVESTK